MGAREYVGVKTLRYGGIGISFYRIRGVSLLYAGFGASGRSAKGRGRMLSPFKYFSPKGNELLLFSPGAVF